MVHTFNPSTQEAQVRGISEFEVSLIYIMTSKTAVLGFYCCEQIP